MILSVPYASVPDIIKQPEKAGEKSRADELRKFYATMHPDQRLRMRL